MFESPVLLPPPPHSTFACGQQPPAHGVVIDLDSFLGQFLGQERRAEVRVARLGGARQHLRSHGGGLASQTRLTA